MATRMQQRRGTAAQWTGANPILAAGEIGFESDSSKFKIGDGVNHWDDLIYYASAEELSNIIDGAPGALNTLNELAAALGDDPAFFTSVATNLSNHQADTTSIHGIADTSQLATLSDVTDAVASISDGYSGLAGVGLEWDDNVEQFKVNNTIATTDELNDHELKTTSVHGIADTAELATKEYADTEISSHNSDTINVHGIADTSVLETVTGSQSKADAVISTHNSDTTNVHGIADTANLATLDDVAAVTKTTIGLGNVDNTSDANKPVSTATETAIATAKSEAVAEVTAVIDGAPNALNTLNELAAALNDDANFAGTVTTALAAKVDSFTPITQKTASYTLSTLDHRDDLIEMGSSSALTVTIPLNSSIAYPVGTSLDILQTGTGQVTIAGAVGVTVNATPGLKLRTQWSSATLFKRAENTWVVYGDLTA